MKKMPAKLSSFFSTILYCIKLSWHSSKLYTVIRLAGDIFIPVISIYFSFILKHILDLLSGSVRSDRVKIDVILWIIASVVAILMRVIIQKIINYCEKMHNSILEQCIANDILKKSIEADLELFDNADYYDRFLSVKNDSKSIANILWSTLNCFSQMIALIGTLILLCNINWVYGILIFSATIPSAIMGKHYTKTLYCLDGVYMRVVI